jgi:hypothetical protein
MEQRNPRMSPIGRTGSVALLLGLALAGCATVDPVSFANGQPGYEVRCDLGLNGLDQCFRTAGNLCTGHGYSLRDWQGHQTTIDAAQQSLDENFSGFAAKTILLQCNPQ